MDRKEAAELVGYELRGGAMVCLLSFPDASGERIAAFNHKSLAGRLANLKAGGWPHDVTESALASFPEDLPRNPHPATAS